MNNGLKLYHKILPVLFIPICIFIIVSFGWIGYATLTERPGLNGDWYYYYQLTRPQFYIFNFTIALIAFTLIIFQIKYLIYPNAKYMTKTFWPFVIFIGLIIIAEFYLSTRLVPKG